MVAPVGASALIQACDVIEAQACDEECLSWQVGGLPALSSALNVFQLLASSHPAFLLHPCV